MLAFGVALRLGAVLLYCFWLVLATGAFWVVRMWFLPELFEGIFQTGRWPVGIYPDWLRFGITFLVPIAFAITVPAEAVTSRLDWQTFDVRRALHRCGVRLHALVLALRPPPLLGRLGVGHGALASRPNVARLSRVESSRMAVGWTLAPVYFVQEVGMDPLQLVLTGTHGDRLLPVRGADGRRRRLVQPPDIGDRGAGDHGISFVVTGLVDERAADPRRSRTHGLRLDLKSGAIDAGCRRGRPGALGHEYRAGRSCASSSCRIGARRTRARRSAAADRRRRRRAHRTRGSPRVRHARVRVRARGTRRALGAPLDDAYRAAGGRLMRARPILLLDPRRSRSSAGCGARAWTGCGRLSSSSTSACPRSEASTRSSGSAS